jgi:hypothetical protein
MRPTAENAGRPTGLCVVCLALNQSGMCWLPTASRLKYSAWGLKFE